LKENNLPAGNNNFNNPLLPPLLVNLFGNIGEFNLPLNNNNNSLSEKLNSNVIALVNTLTGMNLTKGYYLKKESFIKLIEFKGTETKDLNKWLEKFNRIAETNQ